MPRDYELLDFGDGRKLERFGAYVVDRPCLTAEGVSRAAPKRWRQASGRYHRAAEGTMQWTPSGGDAWTADAWHFRQREPFRLDLALAPLPSGQVGVFPEQAENWGWIHRQVQSAGRGLRILNLFAYTGASTIAAAAAEAEVTHVDAADSAVTRARRNAELSGLADARIRWIVDDAVKFSRREVRRGRQYDAVILDPPSYGHGKKGEVWQIERDLPKLLNVCSEVTGRQAVFALLTCHTTGFDAARLAAYLAESGLTCRNDCIGSGDMQLRTADGRALAAGCFARFSTVP
jgi:23S rRNA (cytosine1962-C5)-methyltransferase